MTKKDFVTLIIGVIAAYPVCTRMVKHKKAKPAPEILRLAG